LYGAAAFQEEGEGGRRGIKSQNFIQLHVAAAMQVRNREKGL
jgi:hypothetical protein